MTKYQQEIDRYRNLGFVTAKEAAIAIGRSPGGNVCELLEKHGVNVLSVNIDGKKPVKLYESKDFHKVPPVRQQELPGGKNNGGNLAHQVKIVKEEYGHLLNGISAILQAIHLLDEKIECLVELFTEAKS